MEELLTFGSIASAMDSLGDDVRKINKKFKRVGVTGEVRGGRGGRDGSKVKSKTIKKEENISRK